MSHFDHKSLFEAFHPFYVTGLIQGTYRVQGTRQSCRVFLKIVSLKVLENFKENNFSGVLF